jgi:hypothetical protein
MLIKYGLLRDFQRALTKSLRLGRNVLLLQAELFRKRGIDALVLPLEIAHVGLTIGDELQEPAARVVILFVLLEMRRKVINTLGQNSDLHLSRAGVFLMTAKFLYKSLFLLLRNHGNTISYLTDNCQYLGNGAPRQALTIAES